MVLPVSNDTWGDNTNVDNDRFLFSDEDFKMAQYVHQLENDTHTGKTHECSQQEKEGQYEYRPWF